MNEKLFEQMTSVGMAYVILSQTLQAALNQTLNPEQLQQAEYDARQISGMNSTSISDRSYLSPLIDSFFQAMKKWLAAKENGPVIDAFLKMLNAELPQSFEARYELDRSNLPRWHQQVLETGSKLMKQEKVPPEQIAVLLRNIPEDTAFGCLAIRFLTEVMQPAPDRNKLSTWWSYLSGEQPFICRVQQSGLYSHLEYLLAN